MDDREDRSSGRTRHRRASEAVPCGVYAWSAEKVGHDVGQLCGIDKIGMSATDDIDELLN